MKIGMIVHAYYLKDARVRRYAELLADGGHEVEVLCLREGDEPKVAHHQGVVIRRIGLARLRGGRLSYVYEYLASFVRFFLKLNRLSLSGKRFDILHIHNMPDFLVFCALFQKLFGAKIVLDVHDLMSEVYQSKYGLEADHWLPRALRFEERICARFASAVITANHDFADILAARSVPESKVTVVMNAANDQFFLSDDEIRAIRADKRDDEFHVIYIGTMAPRYGVENAVRAIAKLHREGSIPGLRFSIIPKIANEGSYVDDVIAEVEDAGFADRFEIMEPVPHEKMPATIAASDLMIYTPVPDVHMDIALSLKIPEAIAVGCPIVASRLRVNDRYFGEESLFMFEPGNVDECAARVLEAYSQPDRVRAKVEFAKRKLEEIGWDKQAGAYLNLLENLSDRSLKKAELQQ